MSLKHGAEYYHKRADELRSAARSSRSPEDRCTLTYFADDYDELAEEAALVEAAPHAANRR